MASKRDSPDMNSEMDSASSCSPPPGCKTCTRAAARLRELELEYETLREGLVGTDVASPPPEGRASRLGEAAIPTTVETIGAGDDQVLSDEDRALRDEARRLIEDGTRLRITIDTLVRGSLFEAKELVR
jgi:hypothetical protein